MASSRENKTLEQSARRILVLQACLAALSITLILLYRIFSDGLSQAIIGVSQMPTRELALLYGSLLGMVATWLSKRSVSRSSEAVFKAPQLALMPVYMGLVNKLLIVGGGLAFGLVIMGLNPIFVVSGYLISQLALVWVAIKTA